ncbi:MAG: ATP-binding protein [Actinomycetota bacterium]
MGSRRLRGLPLFWKILLPFMALMLIVGGVGAFVIVHDLATRTQSQLDQNLSRSALDASASLHDRELYLLESVNYAANLQGLPQALQRNDAATIRRSLDSVMALKIDLSFAVIANVKGIGVSELYRNPNGVRASSGNTWSAPFIQTSLGSAIPGNSSGILPQETLSFAAPVCVHPTICDAEGVAIVGLSLSTLADEAARHSGTSVALYSNQNVLLASSGTPVPPPPAQPTKLLRKRWRVHAIEYQTLSTPFFVQGKQIGTISVTTPTGPIFAAVHRAAHSLIFILTTAMLGVIAIGAFISRHIIRQVKPLVETNRAIGSGNLIARAPVLSRDELGELAEGVNQMAEQLQASVQTLELRVEERTAEIRRLLTERTEFFAAMSHELRTPLAVIEGQAQMILDPVLSKRESFRKEAGESIVQSTSELLAFVNDILDLAKSESGQMKVESEDVNLESVITGLKSTIDGLTKAAGLNANIEMPRKAIHVTADARRVHEILVNLVDNAVKYTPPGGRVTIHCEHNGDSASISVRDTGVGIPSEVHDQIFQPFYRVPGTKAQQRRASSGLGLALSKRLAQAQGGDLTFVSQAEIGTTFTLKLPLASRSSEHQAS